MPAIPQKPKQQIHPDFLRFAKMELEACDFDAEHPLLIYMARSDGMWELSLDQKLWLCFLYMAFYDEASSMVVFGETPPFQIPESLHLPIGKNRRNLYGASIRRHFIDLCSKKQQISSEWPIHNFIDDPKKNWNLLKENIGSVWGNGRFATFTTAELIQKVCNLNVEIDGFDNKGSTGPADGISRAFYCDKKNVRDLDVKGLFGYRLLKRNNLKPTYTDLDLGVAESIYCTFGATCRGKYYPGRNLDRQQHRILTVEAMGYDLGYMWELRGRLIDNAFLGELNGWTGIDKERLKLYKETGELLCPNENR